MGGYSIKEESEDMRRNRWGAALLVLMLAAALPFAGCAKKVGNKDLTKGDGTTQDGSKPGSGTQDGNPADGANASDKKNPSQDELSQLIKDIFFDYDDATLSGAARDQLSTNASHLSELSALRLLIEGHCDERGTVEYNLALGQRRADATKGYLVNLGVDGSRLMTRSLGEERPFATGTDESAWSQNRRAHFVVQNP